MQCTQAIVFDFDGVIALTEPCHYGWLDAFGTIKTIENGNHKKSRSNDQLT